MAGISEFLAALKGGGARPNRFETVVNFPAFAGGSETIRQTAFLIQSSQIPGSTLGTIEQPFRGRQLKLAGDRTFEEFECTFVNDTDFAIHDAFERWHNAINAYNSNTGFQAPEEYMATVTIHQLDNQDNRIKTYVMKLAYPQNIGSIELSQESNDTIETFPVTFAYSDVDHDNAS
jgi:hypothetical protein